MDRILNYTVSDADNGMIVLDYLRRQGFSRHILTAMKTDKEALSINGKKAGGRSILAAGDHFRVRLLETVSPEGIIPTPMELSILYEDQDILVINKPADMPVHPSIGNYTNTLANGVAAYLASKGENCPFRCINRLDRDTSGALILAKKCSQCGHFVCSDAKSPDPSNLPRSRRRNHSQKRNDFCSYLPERQFCNRTPCRFSEWRICNYPLPTAGNQKQPFSS